MSPKKPRKPKFLVHYGKGGIQRCFSRKDIGDFLAYYCATEPKNVLVQPVK